MRSLVLLFVFTICMIPMLSHSVETGEPVDMFGDWAVFEVAQNNKTLCYAMTIPQNSKTNYENRGKPFFMIIKEKNSPNVEVNASVGYKINDNIGSIELQIGNNKYPFINFRDRAWAYNIEDDEAILQQFIKSAVFNVYSRASDNRYSMDIYSLNGFANSYNKINELCQ